MGQSVHPVGTKDRAVDQPSRGRLIGKLVERTSGMTTTTTPSKSTTTKTKSNGEDHSQEPVVSTSPTPSTTTPAPEKKPVTVMIPEALHRKVKLLAELSGTSLSDLIETEMKALVKSKLPALLAGLGAEG
jgi:hypothetical protein